MLTHVDIDITSSLDVSCDDTQQASLPLPTKTSDDVLIPDRSDLSTVRLRAQTSVTV